ncbi:MAG TPA: hypothetical protein VGX25_23040 [Actinophytocola sp.]|uniref:hypothetical protein n=1 Tax=Actinophytocola sp. TaxID=1872138 RepID=UPI002DDD715C|nr:hypothetical protein [Actinophytocola sp.]HEV2782277.1 hypothetical protein [Actinophytocola sp.]
MRALQLAEYRSPFDRIMQTRPDGTEFWSARQLQGLMAYSKWQNLATVVARAMQAASNTGMDVAREFVQVGPVTESGNRQANGRFGAGDREDYELSRKAAYLVAMNGDPNKPEVAAAQAYFAERTVQAEVVEANVAGMPEWVRHQMAALVQVGRLEAEQQRQASQLREVAARMDAIEGAHDWYSALAYARLNELPTDRVYLQRVGARAGRLLRAEGLEPGKTQHPAYGTVNTYPEWVLERAFADTT